MVSPHSGIHRLTIGLRAETEREQIEAWLGVLEQLIATANRIRTELRTPLMKGNTLRNADKVKKTGPDNLKFLSRKPKYLKKDLKLGYIRVDTDYYRPVQVIDSKFKNDYNTSENQLLRGVLIKVRQEVCRLKGSIRQKGRGCDPTLGIRLDNLEGQLSNCLKADFMTDVSEPRQIPVNRILQMPPSYQDIYRNYLLLVKR